MSSGINISRVETYVSECTQCPASSSSNTIPGNMSRIIGRLCSLMYLFGSRVSLVRNTNCGRQTYLLRFPFIATT